MDRRLALLRAINVGGRNKVPMADLRDLATSLGYDDVSTYIASGNLLFSSDRTPEVLASELHDAVASRFGLDIDIVVASDDEVESAARRHPFADGDPKKVHTVFCSIPVPEGAVEAGRALARPDERIAASGRLLFLDHGTGGVHDSKMAAATGRLLRPGFGTARNLATCRTLADKLLGPDES